MTDAYILMNSFTTLYVFTIVVTVTFWGILVGVSVRFLKKVLS